MMARCRLYRLLSRDVFARPQPVGGRFKIAILQHGMGMFRIRLRWKFFIILLVFSLTPLIVVTVASQRGTFRLGQAISEDARQRLARR